MTASVAVPLSRASARWLLILFAMVVGLVAALPHSAYAFERKIFGDVVVEHGETRDEVSTAFGDVVVNGPVLGDVQSAVGDIIVNRPVDGDVEAGSGGIEVHAPVGGEVDAGFGDVYINATVGGDVDVGRGDVDLGPRARVLGDVLCASGQIRPHQNAVVEGAVTTGVPPGMDHSGDGSGLFGLVGWALAAAGFAALSVLAAVLVPGPLLAAARRAEESPGWSLVVGVMSVPAVVVLCVVLVVSLVGIPLVLLLAPAYLALVFVGAIVAAYFVGRKLLLATNRYRGGNALAAVVGALIVASMPLIPLLGNLLLYAFALLGTGAMILALLSRSRRRATYSSYEAHVRRHRDT